MDGYLLCIRKLMCRQSLGCITHQAMWGSNWIGYNGCKSNQMALHNRKTRRWLFRLDYASVFASITGSTTLDPAPQIWCAQIHTILPWPCLSHGLPPTASRSPKWTDLILKVSGRLFKIARKVLHPPCLTSRSCLNVIFNVPTSCKDACTRVETWVHKFVYRSASQLREFLREFLSDNSYTGYTFTIPFNWSHWQLQP